MDTLYRNRHVKLSDVLPTPPTSPVSNCALRIRGWRDEDGGTLRINFQRCCYVVGSKVVQ